jgi:hypothetical protein
MSEAANAAIIECLIKRPGGSEVEMADGTLYRFQPNSQHQHVAHVGDMDHVATLVGIKEAYRVVQFLAGSVTPGPAVAMPVGALAASVPQITTLTASPTFDPPLVTVAVAPQIEPATIAQAQDPAPPALPLPDADGEYTAEQIEQLKAIFRTEIGRVPSPKTKPETMVIQIEAIRGQTT